MPHHEGERTRSDGNLVRHVSVVSAQRLAGGLLGAGIERPVLDGIEGAWSGDDAAAHCEASLFLNDEGCGRIGVRSG